MAFWATLDGYEVRYTTERAVGLAKATDDPDSSLIWVPRAMCQDGETLEKGHTDIIVQETMADAKGLVY